ncbi:hypothetical protein VTK73DRAFT_987 [Phialemonium thermophilum]|uniref:SnoaL-like domain-containing protein n=1 Tax=Phialemonium thermophilum TaxID=223376 RepID=A0ABR3XCL4_9PEZI
MADDKAAILGTVQQFFSSLSRRPPFTEAALEYALPDAWCVNTHPGGSSLVRIKEMIRQIEEQVVMSLNGGAKEFQETLDAPDPEVWVHEDMAAVWTGYRALLDGKEVNGGIMLFSLHRTPTGWKISGTANTKPAPGGVLPPVTREARPDVVEPVDQFLQHMTKHEWDGFRSKLSREGGITNSRRSMGMLKTSTWDELVEMIKAASAKSPPGTIYELLHDVEARVCGDFAFLWTPFVIEVQGHVENKGVNIFTMVREGGKWIIAGCQDTSMPTEDARINLRE